MSTVLEALVKGSLYETETQQRIRESSNLAIPRFLRSSDDGQLVEQAWFHEEWHEGCDNERFVFICAPRGHAKTEQLVIGRTCVTIGNNPNIRIKILSGNDDLANKRVRAIREIIEFNQDFIDLYGNLKPARAKTWGDTRFTVKRTMTGMKEPTLEAYGVGSAGTGDRADIVILDDVCNFENTMKYPNMRQSIKEKFDNDIMEWLAPQTGRIIYVCTLWHQDDLSSELKREIERGDSMFKMLFYAINANCDPLWPERFTRDMLLQKQKRKPAAFDRSYRNMPISDEDAIFKRNWVKNSIRIDKPSTVIKDDGNWKIYVGVDLAISKKSTADWTVILIGAVHKELDLRVPIGMIRGRFSSPETARQILDVTKKYKPNLIYVENNAYQASLLEWMENLQDTEEWKREKWAIPNVNGYRTGTQKHDPYEGLPSVADEFANNMWVICNHKNPLVDEGSSLEPCGDDSCFCVLIDELVSYPFGIKDDCVMALWLFREAAKKDLSFFITYA